MNNRKLKVLHIDDDRQFHEGINRALGDAIFLTFVTNLSDAESQIKSHNFDCVLSDNNIFLTPQELEIEPCGVKIAKLCKAQGVRMILLSESSMTQIMSILRSGADDFLLKSDYDVSEIKRKLGGN